MAVTKYFGWISAKSNLLINLVVSTKLSSHLRHDVMFLMEHSYAAICVPLTRKLIFFLKDATNCKC